MTDSDVELQRRQLTLGVLGHVDHGKTALVRALTGIETDRLAEERERGLSIVPGYAWFESGETCIDLIDAPGHQAFIRAMIAAASGIDAAMLVVAANEGVMPQTREHVAIAELLGIHDAVVVLSKSDLVSDAELEQSRQELRRFLDGTLLSEAPICPVAAVNDTGVPELRTALTLLHSKRLTDPAVPFFMPVDRSFTKSGFGRVATGTVHAGTVSMGEELVLVPGGEHVSVRGIQVHGKSVEQAGQGDRAALNLRGAAVDSITSGIVLGHPNAAQEGRRLDVVIEPLSEHAESIRNGAQLRVLIGTAEAQATLRVLEHEGASKGHVTAQLRCDRALPARPGMRFVLRSNSPAQTVGGGSVVDVQAPRRRRFDREGNAVLYALAGADRREALLHYVQAAGVAGVDTGELARRLGIAAKTLDELLKSTDVVAVSASRVCGAATIDALAHEIIAALRAYHREHPQHTGMRDAELTAALIGEPHALLMQAACERLKTAGRIRANADRWHLSDFDAAARLSATQRALVERIEAVFAKSGMVSPSVADVIGKGTAARESLQYLLETGRVVRLQTRDRAVLALHASAIDAVREQIGRQFPYPDEFAVKDVRDLLGTTRKHVVPLLEHLDATGFTLRKGDMRQIRQ